MRMLMALILFVLLGFVSVNSGQTRIEARVLAWSDDFSAGTLSDRWMASTGGLGFSPQNVDLSKGILGLRLTQTRGTDGKFLSVGAEVQSRQIYGFGTYTWEMRASNTANTPTGLGTAQSGSSSALFSFINDSQVEIDFEVEGNLPSVVHMSIWHKPKWTVYDTTIPADTGFHQYRYVWSSRSIEFFVDGKSVAMEKNHVPQKPAYIIMNHWGTTTQKWGGVPTEGTRYMWVRKFSFAP